MSDERIGVGLVGAGGIALSHAAALRTSPRAALRFVCDADAARASRLAHENEIASTGTMEEMLAHPDVDAVIVCTPNATHEAIGVQVLAAGKHLLMEKPLAMTLAGAERLVTLATERGLALAVGHSHRFSDQGVAIHAAVSSGAIGKPRFARIVINGGWIWGGWDSWVLDPERSGGHSLHNGVHLMDLAAWWLNSRATSVFSRGQKVTSAALAIHDYLVTELHFASGASALCEVSRAEHSRVGGFVEVTVVGTEGVLRRDWDAEGVLAQTDGAISAWTPSGGAARTFERELASFVHACAHPDQVQPPMVAALDAVRLALASERSLVSGEVVPVGDTA